MNEPYLTQIQEILHQVLHDCEIYLFGSRATGQYSTVSDFDIAVSATRDIDRELSLARERLEHSAIPFTVDLVNLNATLEEFASQVRQGGILL